MKVHCINLEKRLILSSSSKGLVHHIGKTVYTKKAENHFICSCFYVSGYPLEVET